MSPQTSKQKYRRGHSLQTPIQFLCQKRCKRC